MSGRGKHQFAQDSKTCHSRKGRRRARFDGGEKLLHSTSDAILIVNIICQKSAGSTTCVDQRREANQTGTPSPLTSEVARRYQFEIAESKAV